MLILEEAGFAKKTVTVSNSALVTTPSDDGMSQLENSPSNRGQKGRNGGNWNKGRGGSRGGGNGGRNRRVTGGSSSGRSSGSPGTPEVVGWQWPWAVPPCPYPAGSNWARPRPPPAGPAATARDTWATAEPVAAGSLGSGDFDGHRGRDAYAWAHPARPKLDCKTLKDSNYVTYTSSPKINSGRLDIAYVGMSVITSSEHSNT